MFENYNIIENIFKNDSISLEDVLLHEIKISNGEDLTLSFRLDLKEYPTIPPLKWKNGNYNTCQIVVLFIGVKDININLEKRVQKGKIEIKEVDDKKEIFYMEKDFDNITTKFTCQWIKIDSISAYQNVINGI